MCSSAAPSARQRGESGLGVQGGTAGGCPSRQCDSGQPHVRGREGPSPAPATPCTFFGVFLLSIKTSYHRRAPRSPRCPGWTRTPDFAPALPPAPAHWAVRQEPCTGLRLAGLMLIPWLWLFPLVFTRCITLGGGCGRRSFALPEGRVVGHQAAITASRTFPSPGPRP